MNNYLKAELFNSAFFLHEIFFKAFPTFIICIFLNNCGSSDKIYEVKGTIHEINLDKNEVIISHDTIQGLMYPMIMPFTLTDINELSFTTTALLVCTLARLGLFDLAIIIILPI